MWTLRLRGQLKPRPYDVDFEFGLSAAGRAKVHSIRILVNKVLAEVILFDSCTLMVTSSLTIGHANAVERLSSALGRRRKGAPVHSKLTRNTIFWWNSVTFAGLPMAMKINRSWTCKSPYLPSSSLMSNVGVH
jgi:hypothetical protein